MASNQSTSSNSGTSSSASAPASSQGQEFVVRIPKNQSKKYGIMRFNASNKIDFAKFQQAKIARENNLKEYKTANDIQDVPTFGAGSEFGKEQREEARRKKYGWSKKVYNAEDQPWLLKLGSGKQAKKFKGTREGGISENASYYIFTQCPDGAFEALPVTEWHNFMPLINYKYLNAEEAEEEFTKRDKTMNYFSVMLKKRIRNEEEDEDTKEKVTTTKKKSKDKSFMLTEMEDWGDLSDDSEKEVEKDDDKETTKPKKKKKNFDSEDEAVEESDEGDFDDREVDYMSDSSKSDTDDEEREGKDKYGEKGVEDEDGLRELNESEDEGETEKPKDEEQEKASKQGSDNEKSSSSSSESDSDDPESGNVTSALFMQKKKGPSGSRSNTPTPGADTEKGKKRKGETDSPVPKKVRSDSPASVSVKSEPKPHTPTPTPQSSNEGITEETVRRYLARKPMTTKDLLQKFKSKKTGLSREQLVPTIAAILKKLNPNKEMIKGTMYLSIKE